METSGSELTIDVSCESTTGKGSGHSMAISPRIAKPTVLLRREGLIRTMPSPLHVHPPDDQMYRYLRPHEFEHCCTAAWGRRVCRCGFSEGHKIIHVAAGGDHA